MFAELTLTFAQGKDDLALRDAAALFRAAVPSGRGGSAHRRWQGERPFGVLPSTGGAMPKRFNYLNK